MKELIDIAMDLQPSQEPMSAGERKIAEYAVRIQGGESKEDIMRGLPESFKTGIEKRLAQNSAIEIPSDPIADIPMKYNGLDSEALIEVWTIPEYLDREKTKSLKEKRAKAIAFLQTKEQAEAANEDRVLASQEKVQTLQEKLGVSPPPDVYTALPIDERKKMRGLFASFELAKIAIHEGVDLPTLSREEYVDYAIKHSLPIDDSQLRAHPLQRIAISRQDWLQGNKDREALIRPESDKAFAKYSYEIVKRAESPDRIIDDGIKIRQGTKDSNSWLFFGINNNSGGTSKETFKAYLSMKDLNTLTPDRFTDFMKALRDSNYHGDIKIFQDLIDVGTRLNDQIVMHGATDADATLALQVAEKFFGKELDQKGLGKDEVINGVNKSYSQILAKKIADTINPPKAK